MRVQPCSLRDAETETAGGARVGGTRTPRYVPLGPRLAPGRLGPAVAGPTVPRLGLCDARRGPRGGPGGAARRGAGRRGRRGGGAGANRAEPGEAPPPGRSSEDATEQARPAAAAAAASAAAAAHPSPEPLPRPPFARGPR
ncbi:translation initiation factor IF-2-like [Phyllostomus discolor]|uniref:Translation initiation factor IF-2-like n=1 Tax=Phyllostomus discolor TaxID=89673 RepID=A0A7E6CQZ5_9CHIR|nr:translation initiation factor IF-2-like [Phyllostomus discolor]